MVGLETAYTARPKKTNDEELQAFFKGDHDQQEDVGGWDD